MTNYRQIEDSGMEATGSAPYEQGIAQQFAAWKGKTMGFARGGAQSTGPRVPAFLGLAEATGGVYLENPPTDIDAALREVGLDYEVRKETIKGHLTVPRVDGENLVADEVTLDMPGWFANVAHPNDGRPPFVIAPVKGVYTNVQNPEAMAFGEHIIDAGGMLRALGAYGNPVGAKTYAAFQLPDGMTVGGQDRYDLYLTVINSFDRSGGLVGLTAPIRLDCTNQTTATFGRRANRFSIRHTKSAKGRVVEAREALGLAFAYRDTFVEEAEKLLAIEVPKDRFVVYAREVFKTKAEEDLTTMATTLLAKREEQLMAILAGDACEFGRGTAYAAYQALVEYSDFYAPARGDARLSRMTRIMEGQTERFKDRAWDLAVAMS